MAEDPEEGQLADGALEAAARRLERAIALLEGRVQVMKSDVEGSTSGLFEEDRAQLAQQLDESHARERELEEAGAEASAALGRAIAALKEAG